MYRINEHNGKETASGSFLKFYAFKKLIKEKDLKINRLINLINTTDA